jgi:hypothetical protein
MVLAKTCERYIAKKKGRAKGECNLIEVYFHLPETKAIDWDSSEVYLFRHHLSFLPLSFLGKKIDTVPFGFIEFFKELTFLKKMITL